MGGSTAGKPLSWQCPCKGQCGTTLCYFLGGAEQVHARLGNNSQGGVPVKVSAGQLSAIPWEGRSRCVHNPVTALSTRTLQGTVIQKMLNSPGKTSMGVHCRSLQSVAHTKVKTICPRGYIKVRGLCSFDSEDGNRGTAISFLSFFLFL